MIYDLQKASMWKRISAFLFDFILLSIVSVLCAWLLSLSVGYDGVRQRLEASYERYSEQYGVNLKLSYEEYEALDEAGRENLSEAYKALSKDEEAVKAYQLVIQLSILILSLGILLGCLITEFVVPLRLGNGVTLGKKVFGLAVMQTDGVRLRAVHLFIRTLLGKYAIELMIPAIILLMIYWGSIGIVGPIVLLLILIIQAAVLILTRTNSLIHDLLAGTVVVDYASQMIFDSREDMIRYKEKIHAEKALREPY